MASQRARRKRRQKRRDARMAHERELRILCTLAGGCTWHQYNTCPEPRWNCLVCNIEWKTPKPGERSNWCNCEHSRYSWQNSTYQKEIRGLTQTDIQHALDAVAPRAAAVRR